MKVVAIFLLASVCLALHMRELTGSPLSLDGQIALLQPTLTENHQAVQPANVAAAETALNTLVQSVAPNFAFTCKAGYKRGNNINIVNTMSQPIKLVDTYTDSGRLYKSGPAQLPGNNSVGTWNFVKTGGSATGSTGCLVWQLDNKYNLIVVF